MESGSLVLAEDGAVLESAGDLENDEKLAAAISGLVTLASEVDPVAVPQGGFKKITLTYDDHYYTVCMSNRKIYVVKKILEERNDSLAVDA